MDPNATLAEIRELSAQILDGNADADAADRVAELVTALDGWITNGGFLPAAWAR